MKVHSVLPTVFVDFDGKICSLLFTPGCPFKCGYCYNGDIVKATDELPEMEEVLADLEYRKNFIDGIVLSGGEPLLQDDLGEFIKKIKKMHLLVKLYTNGYSSTRLKKVLDPKLLDAVSMDFKAPFDKYDKATGISGTAVLEIGKSIDAIINSGIPYEFRTTVVPSIINTKEDIRKMGRSIKGASCWILQQYKNMGTLDEAYMEIPPYPPDVLKDYLNIAKTYVHNTTLAGVED